MKYISPKEAAARWKMNERTVRRYCEKGTIDGCAQVDGLWQASPLERICAKGEACPYLSGKAVWPGFNDLASNYPELAKQWHPTKNGDLKPTDVTCGKNKKVFWYLPYDDPETGKHFDFEWDAWIRDRTRGAKCPYFTGNAVWTGYNDFATKHPELAKQWHPTKNENLKPTEIACNRHEAVWWLYPYDDPITGRHFDFVWKAKVENRTLLGEECPFLTPSPKVWMGFNDLATCYPEIAAEFHPTKNRKQTPDGIYKSSSRKYWWKCSKCGKVWRASAKERIDQGTMCSQCRKQVNYCT